MFNSQLYEVIHLKFGNPSHVQWLKSVCSSLHVQLVSSMPCSLHHFELLDF